MSSFSNCGGCIDVVAPGSDISAACTQQYSACSGSDSYYVTMSGTSMACPHVTGVIAQLLQKKPSADYAEIEQMLTCDAAELKLTYETYDTATRNLLLQIPSNDGVTTCSNRGTPKDHNPLQ